MTSTKVISLVTTVATIVPFGFALLASAMLVRWMLAKRAVRVNAVAVSASHLAHLAER